MNRAWRQVVLQCVDNYVGYARASRHGLYNGQRRTASSISMPDFDFKPPAYTGPSREEVINMRKKFVNPGAFGEPIFDPYSPGQIVSVRLDSLNDSRQTPWSTRLCRDFPPFQEPSYDS